MLIRLSAALATVLGLAASSAVGQTPLGTALTYQRQLKNSSSPVSGLHDLRFRGLQRFGACGPFGGCDINRADTNADTLIDGLDTQPFVSLLVGS